MADAKNVKTPKALGCYVTLAKPRANQKGELKYSIALLWPKGTDLKELKTAIIEAAKSKFGPNAAALFGGRLKSPLRDGDQKYAEDPEKFKEFKGTVYVNAKSNQRVSVVDANLQPVEPGELYSGCYFHASLRPYPFDREGNKGVGIGLQSLMLVGHGPRIDGRGDAAEDFKDFQPDTSGEMDDGGLGDMM